MEDARVQALMTWRRLPADVIAEIQAWLDEHENPRRSDAGEPELVVEFDAVTDRYRVLENR